MDHVYEEGEYWNGLGLKWNAVWIYGYDDVKRIGIQDCRF